MTAAETQTLPTGLKKRGQRAFAWNRHRQQDNRTAHDNDLGNAP